VLLIDNNSTKGEVGGYGPAAYFAAQGYWDMPLEWAPGGGYRYVNAGFLLASYIIEKVSTCTPCGIAGWAWMSMGMCRGEWRARCTDRSKRKVKRKHHALMQGPTEQ